MARTLHACRVFAGVTLCIVSLSTIAVGDSRPQIAGEAAFQERVQRLRTLEAPRTAPAATTGTYRAFFAEQLQGAWYAALIDEGTPPGFHIRERFRHPADLLEYLERHDAVVDAHAVNASPRGPVAGRRLQPAEIAARERADRQAPAGWIVQHPGPEGTVTRLRLEFGAGAAARTRASAEGALRDRRIQQEVRRVLAARDADGRPSAASQVLAIEKAAAIGALPVDEIPPRTAYTHDVFVAAEIAVDDNGFRERVVRFHRASAVRRRVRNGTEALALRPHLGEERPVQLLVVDTDGSRREARHVLPERDVVEMRVRGEGMDPALWPMLEFGEPALLRESALANFGLLNAHLEGARRRLAWRKSSIDRIAEPVFLGLNLGGGFAGVGAPLGDAARLAYNVLLSPWYIPRLPTAAQLREMLLLLVARRLDAQLVQRPPALLSTDDLKRLQEATAGIREDQVRDFLAILSETDLEAMRRLARLQRMDAQYRLTVDIATSLAMVVGLPDHGFWKELFGNSYVALNGDVSIKNIIAGIAGASDATSRHLVPLDELASSGGSAAAWLAYFDVTFDLRALVNSLWDWSRRDFAERKLRRPFPYAPDLEDLAAYEVRAFGYPLLFWHKRGLMRADLEAFENDYAYAVRGTRIVRRFSTRAELEAEILANRTVPLGYVRAPDGRGGLADSGLAVFAWRQPDSRREPALILYGLRAFHETSALVQREIERFRAFERALSEGARVEQVLGMESEPSAALPRSVRVTPRSPDTDAEFDEMLADLLELRRARRLARWGVTAPEPDHTRLQDTESRLAARGVDLSAPDPLEALHPSTSGFAFRAVQDGRPILRQWTRLSSVTEMEAALVRAVRRHEDEQARLEALTRGEGMLHFHEAAVVPGEVGPPVISIPGVGPRLPEFHQGWAALRRLPRRQTHQLESAGYASVAVSPDLDGDGQPDARYVTAEFPLREEHHQRVDDDGDGDAEIRWYREGRLVRSVSATRIIEHPASALPGEPQTTRTHLNLGTLDAPVTGPLVEEAWPVGDPEATPPTESIPVRRVRLPMGEILLEHSDDAGLPVRIEDGTRVSDQAFDETGRLLSVLARDARSGAVLEETRTVSAEECPAPLQPWALPGHLVSHVRRPADGAESWIIRDTRQGGRPVATLAREEVGPTNRFLVLSLPGYDVQFAAGLIPTGTVQLAWRDGFEAERSTLVTTGFDVETREYSAREIRPHGTRDLTWRAGQPTPFRIQDAARTVTVEFASDGRSFSGTVLHSRGPPRATTLQGTPNPAEGTWTLVRSNRLEQLTERRSTGGWLIEEVPHPGWRSVPLYDNGGLEQARIVVFHPGPDSPAIPVRLEDQFQWNDGRRQAHVQSWVEGRLHREFTSIFDPSGLVALERQVDADGLVLESRYTPEEDGIRSELWQNGQLREQTLEREDADDGAVPGRRIRVTTDAGGRTWTNITLAGAPLGRWAERLDDRGHRSVATEWFPGTASARIVEERDASGILVAVREILPAAHSWRGLRCDIERTLLPDHRGELRPGPRRFLRAGTGVVAGWPGFHESTAADPGSPFDDPWFATGHSPSAGPIVELAPGLWQTNVTRIYAALGSPTPEGRRRLMLDLRAWFEVIWERQTLGPEGQLLWSESGALPLPAAHEFRAQALLATAATQAVQQVTRLQGGRTETGVAAPGGFEIISSSGPDHAETQSPHLPDARELWTVQLQVAHLGDARVVDEEWTSASGRYRVLIGQRTLPDGNGGRRFTWSLATPEGLPDNASPAPKEFDTGPFADASGIEFLAFHVTPPDADIAVVVRDETGKELRVQREPGRGVAFWPPVPGVVQWLPNPRDPVRGGEVIELADPSAAASLRVVSVAELAQAGLDIRRIRLWQVSGPGIAFAATAPMRLVHGGPWVALDEPVATRHWDTHDGLQRVRWPAAPGRPPRSVVAHAGQRIAASRWHEAGDRFEQFVVFGRRTGRNEPLYSFEPLGSAFVGHYRTLPGYPVNILTLTRGFESPRLESFDPGALADEVAPSAVAFGRQLRFPLPSGARAESPLLNRIRSSVFAALAESPDPRLAAARSALASALTPAAQVEALREHPPIAQAWTSRRPLPWSPGPAMPFTADWNHNRVSTEVQAVQNRFPATGLPPVAPGTPQERLVPTVQAAELARLMVAISEHSIARAILEFYRGRTEGGRRPVLESYDAENGASLVPRPGQRRPEDSRPTSEAQLAVAEAAFALGLSNGESEWLTFGRDLLWDLLRRFRAPEGSAGPRGLERFPHVKLAGNPRLTLWPEPRTLPVGINARVATVLHGMRRGPLAVFGGDEWRAFSASALVEQAAWLERHVRPEAERTGVIPFEFVEIQDVASRESALAPGHTVTSASSLELLDAGLALGWDPRLLRAWLENTVRAHATEVDGVAGLDWTLPLHRPPAVSSEMTARLASVAERLGHTEATAWARAALETQRRGDVFPSVVTTTPPENGLTTGVHTFLEGARVAGARDLAWPTTPLPWLNFQAPWWTRASPALDPPEPTPMRPQDIQRFIETAAWFYGIIVAATLGWWLLRWLRGRHHAAHLDSSRQLLSDQVLEASERRWARRVTGARSPPGREDIRFSNAPVEVNFLMQVRAIYKLVVEWRRRTHGWDPGDHRLVEDGSDAWLNGMDEFAAMVGLYLKWVIKAGRRDGLPQHDPLLVSEDSNHAWSRLVAYFSEFNWALVTLLEEYARAGSSAERSEVGLKIEALLKEMGARRRWEPFDARHGFDHPARPEAFDLLLIQKPGVTLVEVAEAMEKALKVPAELMRHFAGRFQEFRHREHLDPIHPYVLEAARLLPHLLLMGLGGLVWHNATRGGLPIFPFLKQTAERLALDPASLLWALPLGLGAAATFVSFALERYRYERRRRARAEALAADFSVTSMFGVATQVLPALKPGRRWDPRPWRVAGWTLRVIGLLGLATVLWVQPAPSFSAFMFIHGLLSPLLAVEALAIVVPLVLGRFTRWLEDHVRRVPRPHRLLVMLNQLNINPTRPASILWLSLRYLLQPSVPTGRTSELLRLIGFYVLFSTGFFFVGGYLFKSALGIWFTKMWQQGSDVRLVLGSLVFWNTMYLLRFGVFLLITSLAAFIRVRPGPVLAGLAAAAWITLATLWPGTLPTGNHPLAWTAVVALTLVALLPEAWRRRQAASIPVPSPHPPRPATMPPPGTTLAIVYMSGDDLGAQRLTPELLMDRWNLLRDHLDSPGLRILAQLQGNLDDASLAAGFRALHALETRHGTTLWHPSQLVPDTVGSSLPPTVHLPVASADERETLTRAWHARRWLATMMSTAGHGQDTGINLADIALRLAREGLASRTTFFLLSNKYEAGSHNRPSQLRYDEGELGQRARLAELLRAIAPGARAYVVHDWTPFGFKAGGMVGMDLVPEEALRLTHMLILDRNANVHDLDSLMLDIRGALSDPGTVIVVPGRGTTNTRTPVGQGSQALEEGHRALLIGLHTLGGAAAECLGTGWGNLQVVGYGAVQRALVHPATRRMPLTSRLGRGATFVEHCEGLIGFGPNAVGISEDIWGVTQAAHNTIALGGRVRFGRSRAFWHKIRETWSHAEWLAAFPRWAGGLVQLLHDPLMQRLVDFGPLSLFAREIRMSGARFYLGVPIALLNILLLPLAVLGDFSPFVEILAWLWLLGLVMSQVLTLNSLVARMDALGFRTSTALAGAAAGAGIALGSGSASLQGLAPAILVLGLIVGGFTAPILRWTLERGRDLLLFGPQLVIHALGQFVRQSLEFVVSGAAPNDARAVNIAFRAAVGPREDRPTEGYPNLVNLRTVVWWIGLPLFILNVLALARLDFLNVVLLLPVLLFSASVVAGPFLLAPLPGRPSRAAGGLIAAIVGAAASFLLFLVAARSIVTPGVPGWTGPTLIAGTLAVLLACALRYGTFPARVRRAVARLESHLREAGLPGEEAARLAREFARTTPADPEKLAATLTARGIPPNTAEPAIACARTNLGPSLAEPSGAPSLWFNRTRTRCIFTRAFALATLIQLWFFVVPMPESLVVRIGERRLALQVATITGTLLACVLLLAVAAVLGHLVQRWIATRNAGVRGRILQAARRFQDARTRGLTNPELDSAVFALLTDALTYLDQGSTRFAQRTIHLVEQRLAACRLTAAEP